ncbi:MAG: NAD(P)/FAD-dependent oxidoreductase [Ferruginibacter sp.]
MSKPSIIIIGAGATGLIAAKELSAKFNVTMLEAQAFIGGRVQSEKDKDDIIETGAEFIHGNLPLTLGLLKDAGIPYEQTAGRMYRKRNGRFLEVEEMTEGWDDLLQKMKEVEEDTTMQELLDKHYAAPRYELLRRHAKSYVEGFDLADLTRVSVKALHREWEWDSEDEEIYRIPTGYTALIKYLEQQVKANGCVLYLQTVVQEVQWKKGTVSVHASNGEKYTADKLLVTVPVGVLQQPGATPYIHFKPPLPFDENITRQIGYGAVIKVVLKFTKTFWQNDAGFILSDEFFPTWWTQLPNETSILTGWLGGPRAAAISNESDDRILVKAISSLAAIYDKPIEQLRNEIQWSKVFNWQANEFAMGAYSYPTPQTESAQRLISEPIAGTVFFAGEALYTGPHPGTVEAAFESGIRVAGIISTVLNV